MKNWHFTIFFVEKTKKQAEKKTFKKTNKNEPSATFLPRPPNDDTSADHDHDHDNDEQGNYQDS